MIVLTKHGHQESKKVKYILMRGCYHQCESGFSFPFYLVMEIVIKEEGRFLDLTGVPAQLKLRFCNKKQVLSISPGLL